MNGNHTEEEKRNKKNKTKTKRNENEKLEEISKFLISLNTRKKWGTSVSLNDNFTMVKSSKLRMSQNSIIHDNFQSDSIFEPREADTGDMSATDREIEQFKQFCLDSK